jgi:hypothetical protein
VGRAGGKLATNTSFGKVYYRVITKESKRAALP